MHDELTKCAPITVLLLLLSVIGCGPSAPDPQQPVQPVAADDPSVGGEAALDRYPESDERRNDQYDPPTETDAYMHRESNDDMMMEQQCMTGDCPEGP